VRSPQNAVVTFVQPLGILRQPRDIAIAPIHLMARQRQLVDSPKFARPLPSDRMSEISGKEALARSEPRAGPSSFRARSLFALHSVEAGGFAASLGLRQ
jgi:hypothetical protein